MAEPGGDLQAPLSVEEFQQLPAEEGRMELVRGAVVRDPPPGAEHGQVGLNLLVPLLSHVEERGLGRVASLETGFVVEEDPPTVRAPDIAFVSKARLPEGGVPRGYWRVAHDLAVEVVSPTDRADAVEEKALDYLRCGAREVWVVHPRSRTVTVHRSSTEVEVLTADEELEAGEVVPGFRVAVEALFG